MTDQTPNELPAELRAFLYSCVDAIEQVEIVVRLQRSGTPWTARGIAADLGMPDVTARHHLEILVARGLLQTAIGAEVAYRYAPKTQDLQRYGAQLLDYYGRARTQVLQFVSSSPRRSFKNFSDAFKLRKSD